LFEWCSNTNKSFPDFVVEDFGLCPKKYVLKSLYRPQYDPKFMTAISSKSSGDGQDAISHSVELLFYTLLFLVKQTQKPWNQPKQSIKQKKVLSNPVAKDLFLQKVLENQN